MNQELGRRLTLLEQHVTEYLDNPESQRLTALIRRRDSLHVPTMDEYVGSLKFTKKDEDKIRDSLGNPPSYTADPSLCIILGLAGIVAIFVGLYKLITGGQDGAVTALIIMIAGAIFEPFLQAGAKINREKENYRVEKANMEYRINQKKKEAEQDLMNRKKNYLNVVPLLESQYQQELKNVNAEIEAVKKKLEDLRAPLVQFANNLGFPEYFIEDLPKVKRTRMAVTDGRADTVKEALNIVFSESNLGIR